MKKISAFTLLELLIGMIISSIVIGFCYAGYSIIYKQYISYNVIKRQNTAAMELNSILNTDIINAASITFDTDKLILNSEEKIKLLYEFKENYILRKDNEVTDTFMLASVNVSPLYFNESGTLLVAIIKEFSFDVDLFGEQEHFRFTKEYSAETMVNLQIENPGTN